MGKSSKSHFMLQLVRTRRTSPKDRKSVSVMTAEGSRTQPSTKGLLEEARREARYRFPLPA